MEAMSVSLNSIEGHIPSELGQIFSLRLFYCSANNLSGTLPPSLYNLSSMTELAVSVNQLEGRLRSDIGLTMINLESLFVAANYYTGPLPASLANASHLIELDFFGNFFTGSIPVDLGKLQNLSLFSIEQNRLGSGGNDDLQFVTSLTNCTQLYWIGASENILGGSLPKSMSNLSNQLIHLSFGTNKLQGVIPSGIDDLGQLQMLGFEKNHLTGQIPSAIGKLRQLVELYLGENQFSGKIPSDIGNLSKLAHLSLQGNQLQGNIPTSIGNCTGLEILGLWSNKLSGKIPISLFNASSLFQLGMHNNLLTGVLPSQLGHLIHLTDFTVYNNSLSGHIPETIGSCSMLQNLLMHNNSFNGTIPPSLANLQSIEKLDFSHNNLSGSIPDFFSKLKHISFLDLSFNHLEGEVPKGSIFSNYSTFRVDGNSKLCGGIQQLHLAPCPQKISSHHRKSLSMKVILSIVAATVGALVICCLFFVWRKKQHRQHDSSTSSSIDLHVKVSYSELFKATDGFSSSNLIGKGSFGSVYRGVLEHYQAIVAIKVLNLNQVHAVKTFIAECGALRNIRHRNLVKILTSCSTLDYKGNDFKALVFELMSNGSIEEWLHQTTNDNDSPKYLSFSKRIDVAIDVANALNYLHNQCDTPIVHCDLKPTNILLDDDMVAHLGDFGLAKSLVISSDHSTTYQTSASILKGSIGYIAPEYGTGSSVTTHGDVYSYGIVLLEMITGKKPTNEMFCEGLTLPEYVKLAIPEKMMEVMDPQLLQEDTRGKDKMIECLIRVARIGVACSAAEYPKERMDMRDICTELTKVRQVFHENRTI